MEFWSDAEEILEAEETRSAACKCQSSYGKFFS